MQHIITVLLDFILFYCYGVMTDLDIIMTLTNAYFNRVVEEHMVQAIRVVLVRSQSNLQWLLRCELLQDARNLRKQAKAASVSLPCMR